MLLSSKPVSMLYHTSRTLHVKGTPGFRIPACNHSRCSAMRNCTLRFAPPPCRDSPMRKAHPCRAHDDADSKPTPDNPTPNLEAGIRDVIPSAAAPDLTAAVQETNPLIFLGSSWALYGLLIGVSVAFSGRPGADRCRTPCQVHMKERRKRF